MISTGEFEFSRRLFHGQEHSERVVAVVRLIFAAVSLGTVYLDPTTPARYEAVAYGALVTYALYSALLFGLLRVTAPPSRRATVAIHIGDVVAATVLTLFTEGPSSPFFVLFGFTLLAAGYRWGLWETLTTGIVSGLLFGLEAILTADWLGLDMVEGEFELNRFILRCAYLLLLALMVGYLAEEQRLARATAASQAGADERGRMARDLHDGVVQSLIGLKMQVTILRSRRADDNPAGASLEQIESMLDREIDDLRSLMFQLTPIDREPPELETLLGDLVEQFERATNISSRFVSALDGRQIAPHTRRELAHILREALVNVRKHSGARHVLVSASADRTHCTLVVDDDGAGFDFEGRLAGEELTQRRKGPRIIKERVRLIGGSLVVDSRPNVGARVAISVPHEG
jgi:signal transduction histidine kinase